MSKPASMEIAFRVAQFLYREAALIDDWQIDDWVALFAPSCRYEVTPPGESDPETLSPETVYFLISDDRERLEARVTRMKSPAAHAEIPRSRTRHIYSNVRVEHENDSKLTARANFIVYANRNRNTINYMGSALFELRETDSEESFLIERKRMMPDMDALVPQGRVSIFL